ncbi:hypothetical protein GHV40_01110 [Devosia sp. D6-9]|nr:hypothetical protein GHV40_01110 [Devosia sp. D6-9]
MALNEPLDLLTDFPGWSTEFSLLWRQEQSRHASGRTRVKDFGSPIWQATFVSKVMKPNTLDMWRAKLTAAENGLLTFTAYPTSRCRPILHPGAAALPTGLLDTMNANNKAIRVSGLVGVSLSVGDFIKIGTNLYQVMEPAVADEDGLTPLFEVRPHLWPGQAVGDVVVIVKPSCTMTVVPGSVSATADPRTGRGSISWQGIEARG